MSENLTVRLNGHDAEWLLLDDSSGVARLRGNGELQDLAELISDIEWNGDTRVLLPGEDVLLTQAAVPSRQQRQILQAVPFAVEEKLAVDIEDCHFALGSRNARDEIEVAVIDRSKLQEVMSDLKDAGFQTTWLGFDFASVPKADGISVLIDGERAHVLTSDSGGLTVSIDQLALTISLLQQDEDTESAIGVDVYIHPDQSERVQLALSEIGAIEGFSLTAHELEYQPFETLCRTFDEKSINLLQGEFKPEVKRSTSGRSWRIAVIIAACSFLVQGLVTLGQGIFLELEAKAYAEEAGSLYKEIFPADRNVRDMRRRWATHLGGEASTNGSFITLLEGAAAKIPGSSLVIQNINYNESRGDLILQLTAPLSEQLVSFSESLIKEGLQAEIGTISQEDDSVRGTIKIKSQGGQ